MSQPPILTRSGIITADLPELKRKNTLVPAKISEMAETVMVYQIPFGAKVETYLVIAIAAVKGTLILNCSRAKKDSMPGFAESEEVMAKLRVILGDETLFPYIPNEIIYTILTGTHPVLQPQLLPKPEKVHVTPTFLPFISRSRFRKPTIVDDEPVERVPTIDDLEEDEQLETCEFCDKVFISKMILMSSYCKECQTIEDL